MSSIIYLTINKYNRDNNINPFKYIGSDQYNNKDYFGSSKQLKKDIGVLGKDCFEKEILCEFLEEIPNVLLREIESKVQTFFNVAENPEYYNKTNRSLKGYQETEEEKVARLAKRKEKYRQWWDNLSEKDKEEHRKKCTNKSTRGKTYEEIYGQELAKIKRDQLRGEKNNQSKKILHIETGRIFNTMVEAMETFNICRATLKNKCIKEVEFKFI